MCGMRFFKLSLKSIYQIIRTKSMDILVSAQLDLLDQIAQLTLMTANQILVFTEHAMYAYT